LFLDTEEGTEELKQMTEGEGTKEAVEELLEETVKDTEEEVEWFAWKES